PGDVVGVEVVAEGGPEVETRVAGQRFGVDGEPGGAVGGEDVLVVQVPVQEPVARFTGDLTDGGRAVGDDPAGLRVGDALQDGRGALQHAPGDVAEAAAGGCRGGVQPGQEAG